MADRLNFAQHRVSRAQPCPVCGEQKWPCLVFDDQVVCKVPSDRSTNGKFGDDLYWHRPDGAQLVVDRAKDKVQAPSRKLDKAAPDVLNAVYRTAKGFAAGLSRSQMAKLTSPKRGLSISQIKAREYFPWPSVADRYVDRPRRRGDSRGLLPVLVAEKHGRATFTVPGLVAKKNTGRPFAAGYEGIFIPARDPQGRIVGAQIAVDDVAKTKTKYATLSCGDHTGASSGDLIHVSRPTGHGTAPKPVTRVWFTEGFLKADIASDLLGEVVFGAPGKKYPAELLKEYLAHFDGLVEVVVALDEDTGKARVDGEEAKKKLVDQLLALGYTVSVAKWSSDEGKGLDDILLARGKITLADRQARARRHRPKLVDPDTFDQVVDPRPVVSLDDQRAELKEALREFLANRNGTSGQEVLLVRNLPGVGKSTIFEEVAKEYVDRDKTRSLLHFLPTHEAGDQSEATGWKRVYGRTSDKSSTGPCHYPDEYKALSERGVSGFSICDRCPKKTACKEPQPVPSEPFYHGQFHSRSKKQLTKLPGPYLNTPNLVNKLGGGPLIIDDLDLDALAVNKTHITESDILANLTRARAELAEVDGDFEPWSTEATPRLSPAIPLLEILRDFRRFAADQHKPGEPFLVVRGLWTWSQDKGLDLEGAVKAALTAQEYNPLDGVTSVDQVRVSKLGPVPIVSKLVEVLDHELRALLDGKEAWNSRLAFGFRPGKGSQEAGLALVVYTVKPLPAYEGRPIIILNASTTREQAERACPGRKVRVIEPRAELPEGVSIHQHLDHAFGIRALEDPATQARALDEVRQILAKHQGQKVGVITHKSFADQVAAEFPGLLVLNFYNHRSTNSAAKVNAWIVLGTPHPREAPVIRDTEALYWQDPRPISPEVVFRSYPVTDVNGLTYAVSRRTFLDSRLQEQFDQRTSLEMEQAVYRCRPLNLDAPEQGDLFDNKATGKRTSVDIYVFSSIPLGIPVNVVSKSTPRKPDLVDQVVDVARELVRAGRTTSQRNLEAALKEAGLAVSYRAVLTALRWLRKKYGDDWLDVLAVEETPPRATSETTAESFDEPLPVVVKKPQERPPLPPRPPAPERPTPPAWKAVTRDIATATARPERGPPATDPPPTPAELWEALREII